VPYTRVGVQDQLRLGAYLADITEPLAQHFGIQQPGGVLVYMTLPRLWEKGPAEGDVIHSFNGNSVTSLSQLQELVDKTPEDDSITLGVRRGGETLKIKLESLGPSVPGVNHMSAEARERLLAALDRGDLHRDHLQGLRPQSSKAPDPTATRSGFGAITKFSDSSITIELFDTGSRWTLAILPSTSVAGYGARNGLADLNVGEFVEVIARNDKAEYIYSKSAPLRPP
jgi:PDZ domain